MIYKNFRKKRLSSRFLLGLFVLGVLFSFILPIRIVSANAFVNFSAKNNSLNIDFSPTITKIHSLGESITSTGEPLQSQTSSLGRSITATSEALTSSVLDAVREFITPESELTSASLLNAYRDYVEEAPTSVKTVTVQGAQGIPGPEGKQGKEGPPGPPGPPGTNGSSNSYPAVIYTAPPAPSANFSGASYFSATNITSGLLSADTLKVTELKVSGSSTFTGGLNVTGASTFGALTVTSCTGCSPTTSLALSTSISDETGSGALVFANTPTLVTPILGVATITSIAIGANTLDTTEWAFLDSINQTLATTSSPSFTHLNLPLQGELRLKDADSSNYVRFKSPSVVGSNQIWTLPSTDSSGCFQSNGVGLITIAACSGAAAAGAGITND